MKHLLLVILLLIFSSSNYAQSKIFLAENGSITDSLKAKSYLLIVKADSVLAVKQYTMRKEILMRGTYKGEDLKIPHGKFYYYFDPRLNFKIRLTEGQIDSHPANKLESAGEYNNGLKIGVWEEYYTNGNKKNIYTYKSGILDGLYQSYNRDNGNVYLAGNYVNGKEDGEWNIYSLRGNLMKKEFYEKGKIINTVRIPLGFDPPTSKYDFPAYIGERVISLISPKNRINAVITCKVAKNGKLLYSSFIDYEDPSTDQLKNKVRELIENAKPWTPAYDPTLKDNIEYELTISIRGKNGDLYVGCSEDGSGLSYQFNH
jgi:antitoxin component YwqK of YwqJK toxin-antitoxin module